MVLRTFFMLFCLLYLASSENALSKNLPSDILSKSTSLPGIPAEASTFEVNAKMVNFSSLQKQKVQEAIELIKKVVSSEEFKIGVINKTYRGRRNYADNAGFSNEEIYQKILQASETLSPKGKNNSMDVELELYFETRNTIGYTFPHTSRIFMNKKYFNNFEPYQVADNIFHEWLHKLGFEHDVSLTSRRKHSIPYSVGYLVKKLARSM